MKMIYIILVLLVFAGLIYFLTNRNKISDKKQIKVDPKTIHITILEIWH